MSEIQGDPSIDITKPPVSVKVGLDRDELQAEFERMAQEDDGEVEKQKNEFMESVERLKGHESLTPGQQADVLETLRDTGGDNPRAWEYFFSEGGHRSLLVLMNSQDFGEEVKRLMKALKVWEIVFEFVGRIPDPREQDMVYRELRREGMVETMVRLMKDHRSSNDHTLQRKAFYFLHMMVVKELEAKERKRKQAERRQRGEDVDEDEEEEGMEDGDGDKGVVDRMKDEGEIVEMMKYIEGNASYYTEDIIKKVGFIRRLFDDSEEIAAPPPAKKEKQLPAKPKKPAPPTSSSPSVSREPSHQQPSPSPSPSPSPYSQPQHQPHQQQPQHSSVGVGGGSETDPLLRGSDDGGSHQRGASHGLPLHHVRAVDEAGCCQVCIVS